MIAAAVTGYLGTRSAHAGAPLQRAFGHRMAMGLLALAVCVAAFTVTTASAADTPPPTATPVAAPSPPGEGILDPTWNPSKAALRERQLMAEIRDALVRIARHLEMLPTATGKSADTADTLSKQFDATMAEVQSLEKRRVAEDVLERRYRDVLGTLRRLQNDVDRALAQHPPAETPPSGPPDPTKPGETPRESPPPTIILLPAPAQGKGSSGAPESGSAASLPTQQLSPFESLATKYPEATFQYMAVGVPDPRVPRHQRTYEVDIGAVMSGMADAGFVLDRYWFPWVNYRDNNAKPGATTPPRDTHPNCSTADAVVTAKTLAATTPPKIDEPEPKVPVCFGLMVFRQDDWRGSKEVYKGVRYSVVYVLPETVTYGVEASAIAGVVAHIASKLPALGEHSLWHSSCSTPQMRPDANSRRLLIAGPAFSGSATSYANALRPLVGEDLKTCLLSYSATVETNPQLDGYALGNGGFHYATLVENDKTKREKIFAAAKQLGFDEKEVVFFAEKSTFGNSVCSNDIDKRCVSGDASDANVILFDSNIAALRERHAQQTANSADSQLVDMMNPRLSKVLRVDDMAENGSEFPVSRNSSMNIAGEDLALARQIARFRLDGRIPRMVVVAATEVRDRLYLISAIKEAMPWVITADLESDILLTHPDFIAATRGTLLFGTQRFEYGRTTSMQTDSEVMLRQLVTATGILSLQAKEMPEISVDLVGRNGPRPSAYVQYDDHGKPVGAGVLGCLREWFGLLLLVLGIARLAPWRRFSKFLVRRSFSPWYADFRRPIGWLVAASRLAAVGFVSILLPLVAFAAFCLGWFVLVDPKNDLLDKLLICVVFSIGIWSTRQAWRIAKFDFGTRSRAVRLSVWCRRHLFCTTSGRTLALGVFLGLVACLILTVEIARILFATAGQLGSRWPSRQYNLLDISVTDGLAVSVPYVGTVALTLYAGSIALSVAALRAFLRKGWSAIFRNMIGGPPAIRQREVHKVSRLLLWVFIFPAIYLVCPWTPLGASGLGVGYDIGFFAAMVATATTTVGALTLVVGYLERLMQRCDFIVRYSRGRKDSATGAATFLGPWHGVASTSIEFAYTPIVAAQDRFFPCAREIKRATGHLAATFSTLLEDSQPPRAALYLLLVSEVSAIRTLLALAMLSCFAGVLLVYSFPVPRRDALLFVDLALMILTAMISAYATIRLERHALVSRILCDKNEGIQLSLSLIRTLAFPFVLIALSLLIAEVPGVREWSGSYLGSLLKLIGGGR